MGEIITATTNAEADKQLEQMKIKKNEYAESIAEKLSLIYETLITAPIFVKTDPADVFKSYIGIIRKLDEKLPSFYGKEYTQEKLDKAEAMLKDDDDLSMPRHAQIVPEKLFEQRKAIASPIIDALNNDCVTVETSIFERLQALIHSKNYAKIAKIDELLETEMKDDPRYKWYNQVKECTNQKPFDLPIVANMPRGYFLDRAGKNPEEIAQSTAITEILLSGIINQKKNDGPKIEVVPAGAKIARTTIEQDINPNTRKPGIHIERKVIDKIR